MSTKSTNNACPRCKHFNQPEDVFCGNCGFQLDPKTDNTYIIQPQNKSVINTLTRRQASTLLYLISTVVIGVLVGIVLNGLGILPSSIASIGSSIGGLTVLVSGVSGAVLDKQTVPMGIWNNANRPLAALASLLTVIILTGTFLFASSYQSNSAIQIGKLLLNDPLSNNSKGYNWEMDTDGPGTCYFTAGAYHAIQLKQGDFTSCTAFNTNFSNFRYEVRMTIIKGYGGGMIFRSDGVNGNFYYFRISQDGTFAVNISKVNNYFKTIQDGSSSAIKTGPNQSNLLSVLANTNFFDFYVNNQLIATVTDGTYTEGKVGVIAVNKNGLTEIAFSNVNIWTI